MIGFGKYLDAGKERARKCLIFLAGVFALMLIFLCAVEKLAYRGEDWRIFSAYNKARANIYDYEGFPDYDAYKTNLSGITSIQVSLSGISISLTAESAPFTSF